MGPVTAPLNQRFPVIAVTALRWKLVKPPASAVTPAYAASATKDATNAYSMRSCPPSHDDSG
jgi:hypothetical protein